MWREMGLRVSMPKQNDSGNSNDGNTARDFACTKFSSTTSLNENLLEKFHIILIAISSNYLINSDKFRSFCDITFPLYMRTYQWYPYVIKPGINCTKGTD